MKTSVVIPTYRRVEDLQRCLAGLARQHHAPDEVLIAVRADDAETRGALPGRLGEVLPLIVVDVGHANASEARNRCCELATGEIIAMLDDDTVPCPGWLAAIHRRFAADPLLGGLGGPDWRHGEEIPLAQRPLVVGKVQWWGRRVGHHHLGAREMLDVEWLKGANMSFRRAALGAVPFGCGLSGSGAQFAEDVALSLRVRRAGWRLRYDPEVAVDHFPGGLMAGVDHRTLGDHASLRDASHNETVAMLDYFGAGRRAVFVAWTALVGTKLLPGMAAAAFLVATGHAGALGRLRVVLRGRRDGWRTWRARGPIVQPLPGDGTLASGSRVCLVTHVVTPRDGQGRVNYELARYLVRQGHTVTLVASAVEADLRRERGISWIRIPVPRRSPAPLQWALFALVAKWKLRKVALDAFDVIHLNGAIAPLPAHVNTSHYVHATSRRTAGLASPRAPFNGMYQNLVARASSYFERRAYGVAGKVIAVSEAVRRSLADDVGLSHAAIEVIHNGVDTAEFRPRRPADRHALREAMGVGEETFVLLFVGDAKSPRKNLDLALHILARLDQRFHLAVIGGSKGGPYPTMANTLGVSARAHFLGRRGDVAECYRDADVVICAAHYEPASLVLLEAMASAVPVISTADVGNAVFVRDGSNGFLLGSSTDVERAVAILEMLAADPALRRRIGEAARDTTISCTWERMAQRYEALYANLESRACRPRAALGAA